MALASCLHSKIKPMGIADFIIVAGYVYTWVSDIIFLTEDVFVEVTKCLIVPE